MLESHYQYINTLVTKAQGDDGEALAELEHYYQPMIIASIKRCIQKEPALKNCREDLDREAFIVLHNLVKNYDSQALTWFSYYLSTHLDYALLSHAHKTLLSFTCASKGIRETTYSELPNDWDPQSPEDPFGKIWMTTVIGDAMSKLNGKQREAVDLYFFQDLTQEQAAVVLNINQASFCKRLQRAVSKLRSLIPKDILE